VFEHLRGLVVEDDAHSLIAITDIFNELGIQYKRNTTGTQVMRQLHTMHPKPDFILISMDLSEGDTLAICKAIRVDSAVAQVPVIVMGSIGSLSRQPQAQAAGCAGFLLKPLPRKQFGLLLHRILAGEAVWQEAV
jgi:PleD family two-component response regulator